MFVEFSELSDTKRFVEAETVQYAGTDILRLTK